MIEKLIYTSTRTFDEVEKINEIIDYINKKEELEDSYLELPSKKN